MARNTIGKRISRTMESQLSESGADHSSYINCEKVLGQCEALLIGVANCRCGVVIYAAAKFTFGITFEVRIRLR
jgi:hypothetical protein